MGEACEDALRVEFDGLVKLECQSSTIRSDDGVLAHRQLDEGFGLTLLARDGLTDVRTASNVQHSVTALLCQSIYRLVSRLR